MRPVKIVVCFEPGGPADYVARSVAQEMGRSLGQPVIVENRPGAGGTICVDAVARAPADGYTLVMAQSSNVAVAPHLYSRLPYEPMRDLAPIANLARTSYVLTVNPNVPARSVQELIELARAKKGGLTYGSGGSGSMSNLAGELFKATAGVDMLQVPYKGAAPFVTAAVAGQVDVIFPDVAMVGPLAKSGKLRPLAVTSSRRSPASPDLPTMAEAGVAGYAVDVWYGLAAPAATPKDIVARLSAAIAAALKNGEFRSRWAEQGFEAVGDTPEQFAATIKADIEKFGVIIRSAGIKPER